MKKLKNNFNYIYLLYNKLYKRILIYLTILFLKMSENNFNIKNPVNLQNLENQEKEELYKFFFQLKTVDTFKNKIEFSIEKTNFFGERISLKFIFPENIECNFNIIYIHIPFGELPRAYEIHIHKQFKIYSFLCNNFNHLVSVILQLYNNPILQMYKNGSEYQSAFGRLNIVTGFNDDSRRHFGNQNRRPEFHHTPPRRHFGNQKRNFDVQFNSRREFGNQNRELEVQPTPIRESVNQPFAFGSQHTPIRESVNQPFAFGNKPAPIRESVVQSFVTQNPSTFGRNPFGFGPELEVNPSLQRNPFGFGQESESEKKELESNLTKKRKTKAESNLEEDTKKTVKTRKTKN